MGRRRKIFTKREYERLSKTHQGRQHIRKTYASCAFYFSVLSVFGIIIGFIIEYLQMLAILSIISCIVSIFIGCGFVFAYKEGEHEEAERIKHENEERIRQEKLAIYQAQIRAQQERERIEKLKASNMETIDKMPGHIFEEFIAAILSDLGYSSRTTKKSGDFGADLIIEKDGVKSIVQLKRYTKKVSVSAIQEITTAQNYYGIHNAWVITNNYFTKPAIELARSNNIKLIDRDNLIDLILKSKKQKEANKESASASGTTVEELFPLDKE